MDPTYEEVSSGTTGHAESLQVTYDPSKIDYEKLLDVFWHNIDPLARDRQFCDIGEQYRSAIFYHDDEQKRLAEASKRALEHSRRFEQPIATHIVAAEELARQKELTTRIAYNLFPQKPKEELSDFEGWQRLVKPDQGHDFYRMNGAGEMLVFSAADFEDFLEPRPDLGPEMEPDLISVVSHLAKHRWPFRLHATYDESISRALDVFETVDRDMPLDGVRWFLDHAETISPRNIERVRALGGGIAIQHRMAFQGEHFVDRYGPRAAENAPPISRMLEMGVTVGAGTDATRVASYNPFVSLYWLVTGKTVGGTTLYPETNRLDRMEALRLWTEGSAWFSGESGTKGRMAPGQLADLAVLSRDYFSVPVDDFKSLESSLTLVGGTVVHASNEFSELAPPPLPLTVASGSDGWGGAPTVLAGNRAQSRGGRCGCAGI